MSVIKLYRIRDWDERYENNRSRRVKSLQWVPTPNHHDGDGFIHIMSLEDAAEVFAGWMLILQVASRCHPRGTLVRGNGTPHSAASLAAKTRGRVKWFEKALKVLSGPDAPWLEIDEIPRENSKTHPDVTSTSPRRHPDVTLVTKKEGKKERKKEGKGKTKPHLIPEGFKPTDNHEDIAKKQGINLAKAVKFYINWARGKGVEQLIWNSAFTNALNGWLGEKFSTQTKGAGGSTLATWK
tara:strand:+ start:167 stop:883 length:717 start_codon:yes stop_codon:yes gene_type:complete